MSLLGAISLLKIEKTSQMQQGIVHNMLPIYHSPNAYVEKLMPRINYITQPLLQ